ncbi:aldehyde dehydrogenase family protein [Stigmatella aurantiaca]|uniref:Succinate-semialdehyde dehydrogenase n=1 Tax=Stigmatella aurantiaca (strain DW4/3-1) TaxID=378806 RepID=Q08TM5_STIAD|nr:aldehyde dehydrogenase family protein [Stigmatella aurantiaca]ADO73119.1 succinate-semialdehyde dehydrogenase [Stigmatella aurantiaca DW4/3-1]EAU63834.1 succinate-semialdehyde dehydrogenase [Stigmatella aurantiaca DW4/3-1]
MLAERYPYYLANRPRQPNAALAVTDKYTGETVTHVALADADAVEQAIAAAALAAGPMRRLAPYVRQEVLEHCVRRFHERAEEFALALCIEAGKPLRDARGEVTRLIETFKAAAGEAVRGGGELLNLEVSPRTAGYRGFTQRVPIGPCSFITPFNFPLNLVAHKVAPAIAAGCPFVLKPSDRTPVSALLMAEVLAETALPEGAFSVLPVRLEDIGPFIEDDRLKLLSFTGSEKVGWDLKVRAGRKKVVLELGGNAACVVDRDQGDRLDFVADRIALGAFFQAGQSCISVQRVLVHEELYGALRERLIARARALRPGNPREESTTLGPMIDEPAARRLEGWIAQAVGRGARILTGGGRRGALLDATVLEGVPEDEPLSAEEAFGPVVLLQPFHTFDDALRAVNGGRYGLQAGLFTRDLSRTLKAWDELEVGGVIVGDVPSFRVDTMPYGGVKGSGLGREGVKYAMEDMTEPRLLVLRQE